MKQAKKKPAIQSKRIGAGVERVMMGLRLVPEGQLAAEEVARISGLTVSTVLEFLIMLGLSEMLRATGNDAEADRLYQGAMMEEERARLVFKAFDEMSEEFKSPFREEE